MLIVDPAAPDAAVVSHAAAVLRRGGLVAFATETVYGLGADATSEAAVRRIFAAKGRPADNPLIVHVADLAMAQAFAGSWPETAQRLAEAGWPGPLTLVVPKSPKIPDLVTAGLDTVGLRVPATAVARALIREAGVPLAAPSANRSEHVSPTVAQHVYDDLNGQIDCILDSGPTEVGIESTVIDCCGEIPRVLRPGPLDIEQLGQWLGGAVAGERSAETTEGAARSPGQSARHYAPKTPALRVETAEELTALDPGATDIVISIAQRVPASCTARCIMLLDPPSTARELYATLRYCDAIGMQRIIVMMPPQTPAWNAVRDRLRRATTTA